MNPIGLVVCCTRKRGQGKRDNRTRRIGNWIYRHTSRKKVNCTEKFGCCRLIWRIVVLYSLVRKGRGNRVERERENKRWDKWENENRIEKHNKKKIKRKSLWNSSGCVSSRSWIAGFAHTNRNDEVNKKETQFSQRRREREAKKMNSSFLPSLPSFSAFIFLLHLVILLV